MLKIYFPFLLLNAGTFSILLLWLNFPLTADKASWVNWGAAISLALFNLACLHFYRMSAFNPNTQLKKQLENGGDTDSSALSDVGEAAIDELVSRHNTLINQLRESRETSELNRKQNKHLLERHSSSEAKSKALLNSSLDAIVTANRDGVIVDFNSHAEAIFGWQKAEIVGKQLSEIIIPQRFRSMHDAAMAKFDKNKESKVLNKRIELVALHKEGHEFFIEIAICTVDDGEALFFAAFIRDISEQKRLHMESLLASCVFNINIPMFVTDHEAHIIKANDAFKATLGYPSTLPEDFKATRLFFDNDKSVRREMWTALDEKGSWSQEVTIIKADGSHFPALAHVSVIPGEDPNSNRYVCELKDISESKEYENKLKDARELAEQASEAKGRFLATMSHEIRTPMNAVLGILELLEEDNVHPEQLKLIHLAMSSGTQLLEIINSILDLSRMNSGNFTISPKPFSTEALIESTRGIMQTAVSEKNLSLLFQTSPALPGFAVGDFTRIRQILINLIDNAVKFTDKGSIAVTLSAVAMEGDEFELLCDVTDTGIGIDEAFKSQLFDEFTMADNSSSRQRSGAGLGLSICMNLVKKMHGQLSAQNNRNGTGARFSFSIRLSHCTEEEIAALRTVKKNDNLNIYPGIRILVAEDNESNRLIVENQLLKEDIQLIFAENGKQAVEISQQQPFDVILMDISMPEMDGLEATRRIISAQGINAQTPIIALTAHSMENEINRFKVAGMCDHLSKPCTKKCLFEKINYWSQGNQSDDLLHQEQEPETVVTHTVSAVPTQDESAYLQYKLFDTEVLNRLIYDTSREVVPKLLTVYISETRKILQQVVQARDNGDLKKIEFAAHSVKSSSASHANLRLHAIAKDIERRCIEGDEEWVFAMVAEFERIAEASLQVSEQVLEEMTATGLEQSEITTPVR
ncbi:PAS domain-containing hybrid sensor histidine kinase/response regulator [Alteromonas lipolytica]|uniref:histidine kinase n=1 Tax=Alteromonas lipolytica TaxID=1856405 RepID=A0A1E8FAU9_9ALTE|nr:PAS domain S-box protein [Alteromonas lipolytica]OFI33054.1 hypothetical protein BFC17_01935 [Alteromonas lipolytica]